VTAGQPQLSILDARLAEIDERLRTIQTGLADDRAEPDAPCLTAVQAALPPRVELPRLTHEPAADLIAELRALAAIQERLLASLRAFEQTLSALDGVRAVRVRGYEGGDRALLDVHLT
jgi:hypothetical protein